VALIADLAAQFHTGYRRLHVRRVRQLLASIRNRVGRIGAVRRIWHGLRPTTRRPVSSQTRVDRIWPHSLDSTSDVHQAGLQIRGVEARVALPEVGRLDPVCAAQRLAVLPDTVEAGMVCRFWPTPGRCCTTGMPNCCNWASSPSPIASTPWECGSRPATAPLRTPRQRGGRCRCG